MQDRRTMEQLIELFNALVDTPEALRPRWFVDNPMHPDDAQRLRNMLRADGEVDPDFLDASALLHAQALNCERDTDIEPNGLIGQLFGSFRLVRLLGQGGMATVFLGERVGADFAQYAAVKLLRRGLFSAMEQKLFRRERSLLAQLSHPGIAHLIDGGVTEAGIPYLIMEFVDGLRIDQYVKTHQLDVRARLTLFIATCYAVDAAHRSLIVHRDIKPSNILVNQNGIPKLVDFGIAKLLPELDTGDSPYRTLTAALTPGYAAPEQIAGKPVTTAVDVYALGVVLHELLTGKRPDVSDTVVASRSIQDIERLEPGRMPQPARDMRRVLQGDLDNIVARALFAEPEHRYASVIALIEDIERYLDGRPVLAHPRSRWYALKKIARRHRAVVSTALLFSVAVIGALAVAVWQANSARVEAQRANVVRDFLLDLLDTAKANLPPEQQPTPVVLAERAAQRLENNDQLPEEMRAELLFTLAQVSFSAAAYDQAVGWLEQVISIRQKLHDPEHPGVIEAIMQLAAVRRDQGRYSDARMLLGKILPTLRVRKNKMLVDALTLCATLEMAAGATEAAFACMRDSTATAEQVLGPYSEQALLTRLNYGDLLGAADRNQEAVAVLEPALSDWRHTGLPTERMDYVTSLSNLGVALFSLGQTSRAVPVLREVYAARHRVLPKDHPDLANSLASLGMALSAELKFDEADARLREALRIVRSAFGLSHVKVVVHLVQLATNEQRRGRSERALEYARNADAICQNADLSVTAHCAHAMLTLAIALRDSDAEASLHYIDTALIRYRALYATPHLRIAAALDHRARTLLKLGNAAEALSAIEGAATIVTTLHARQQQIGLIVLHTRASVLHQLDRHSEALAMIDSVIALWQDRFTGQKDRLLLMLETKARIEIAIGRPDAARQAIQRATALGVDVSTLPESTRAFLGLASASANRSKENDSAL